MLRTNSRKALENIRKEIMDSYEAANEYYTFEGREAKTDFNEICADILEAFVITSQAEQAKAKCSWTGCRDFQQRSRLLMIFFLDQRPTFLKISLKRQRKKRQDTQRTKPRNQLATFFTENLRKAHANRQTNRGATPEVLSRSGGKQHDQY